MKNKLSKNNILSLVSALVSLLFTLILLLSANQAVATNNPSGYTTCINGSNSNISNCATTNFDSDVAQCVITNNGQNVSDCLSKAQNPPANNSGTVTPPAGAQTPGATGSCPSPLKWDATSKLCLPPGVPTVGLASAKTLPDLIVSIIQALLTLAGVVSVLILIIGGFWYITSAGNEEQAEKGKNAIVNAIIGLVVVILAYAIVTIISATLVADKLIPTK